jgi:hypothetical protein
MVPLEELDDTMKKDSKLGTGTIVLNWLCVFYNSQGVYLYPVQNTSPKRVRNTKQNLETTTLSSNSPWSPLLIRLFFFESSFHAIFLFPIGITAFRDRRPHEHLLKRRKLADRSVICRILFLPCAGSTCHLLNVDQNPVLTHAPSILG